MKTMIRLCFIFVMGCSILSSGQCEPDSGPEEFFNKAADVFSGRRADTGPEEFLNKAADVFSGRRKVEIEGNILEGNLEVSVGYTKEEKLLFLGAGLVGLVVLCCLAACCKACCCPNKPRVIMYQHMPPAVGPVVSVVPASTPARDFPQVHTNKSSGGAPPPYPGFPV